MYCSNRIIEVYNDYIYISYCTDVNREVTSVPGLHTKAFAVWRSGPRDEGSCGGGDRGADKALEVACNSEEWITGVNNRNMGYTFGPVYIITDDSAEYS